MRRLPLNVSDLILSRDVKPDILCSYPSHPVSEAVSFRGSLGPHLELFLERMFAVVEALPQVCRGAGWGSN